MEHAIAVAKDSDREDFPCFFRRNYPSRDSQRLSRGTPGGSNWTRAGLNAWESTDIETDSKEPNDFTKWMDQSPITVSGNASMELVLVLYLLLPGLGNGTVCEAWCPDSARRSRRSVFGCFA